MPESDEEFDFEEQSVKPKQLKPQTLADVANRIIDVSRAKNTVWLVKVPSFLADHWSAAHPHAELGTIDLDKRTLELLPTQTSVQILDQVPKNYEIKFSSPANMVCFTEANGNAVAIEGTVQHECNVVPVLDNDYRTIMRARRELAEQKRSTQLVETRPNAGIQTGLQPLPPAKKRRNEDIRRDRLPKDAVIEMIFKAFQQKEYWSMKEMLEHTNQPTAWIKELMGEVCIYIQRGPYKAMYQLRPEYKK